MSSTVPDVLYLFIKKAEMVLSKMEFNESDDADFINLYDEIVDLTEKLDYKSQLGFYDSDYRSTVENKIIKLQARTKALENLVDFRYVDGDEYEISERKLNNILGSIHLLKQAYIKVVGKPKDFDNATIYRYINLVKMTDIEDRDKKQMTKDFGVFKGYNKLSRHKFTADTKLKDKAATELKRFIRKECTHIESQKQLIALLNDYT